MATVKEKFTELLKGKGLTGEDADNAMLATFPNLRWDQQEREYPPQFYADKLPEILANAPKKTKPLPALAVKPVE